MSAGELAQLLRLADPALPTLAVLDENSGGVPPLPGGLDLVALSNRHDLYHAASEAGWRCDFNDFELDATRYPGRSQALYRVSKEKAVVEHVLDALWRLLPADGLLHLAGYKNEGIKTYASRAQAAWDCDCSLRRGERQLHLYTFHKRSLAQTPLATGNYHELRAIGEWHGKPMFSKPGLFAWDRFDAGSLLLLEQLPALLRRLAQAPAAGLDLGCGSGLLALALLEAGCTRVVATDNNAAALRACNHNLMLHGSDRDCSTVAGNCGDSLHGQFDLLLCNPPFHQGFAVEQNLTDAFLAAAQRLLARSGQALFVVNAFIPLERKASAHFAELETLADDKRYKVLRLARPLRPQTTQG